MRSTVTVSLMVAAIGVVAQNATAAPQPNPSQAFNSANRLLFWVGAKEIAGLSDEQLDYWGNLGVGGFICMSRHLPGMGGTAWFTGDAVADLGAKGFALQRAFRDSRVVERAKQRQMKMYLGCHLVNYYNASTPLKDWFDDAGWAEVVLPRIRDLAAAARLLGFDGIAFDEELYPQKGRVATATWEWNYPGNSHTEGLVRAQACRRGGQMMRAILQGFPAAEIVVYHYQFPETWWTVVQERVNQRPNAADPLLFVDFWDGMSSVEGYQAIRFINAVFYKTTHVGHNWDAAFQYEFNSFYSLLSRRLSNWSYASSRVFQSPFSWINAGPRKSAYDAARPPEHVASQLEAFKRWGMGGEFANFCYGGLNESDYAPYRPTLKAVSEPTAADSEPPRLVVTTPSGTASLQADGEALNLAGFATDNLAIRVVRWKSDRGGEGAAQMIWKINSGDSRAGYDWQMNWFIDGIALQPGMNRILLTAEDIKGLTSSETVPVNRP